MLETVIGAIAVVFVTTMIIWMNRNASALKGELEREAQQAINTGGSLALATMAFLAVLKEASKPPSSCWRPPRRPAAAGWAVLAAPSASQWRSSSALASSMAGSS